MDTFTTSNYSITSSLNERTIYLKIIDTIQYLSYEGNIELKELKLPITLKDAYTLITKCLSNKDEHLVKYSKNTNILRLDFTAKVGGYMNISFDVMLKECIIGDDSKMSMKLFEMDISNRKKSEELEKKCQDLKYTLKMTSSKIEEMQTIIQRQSEMIELFGNITVYTQFQPHHNTYRHSKINIENVEYYSGESIDQFVLFYNCKQLNIKFHKNNLEDCINNNVEELNTEGGINSLKGIHNMPNLKIINIKIHPNNNNTYEELILKYLKEYDNKITQISITYQYKPNPCELQKYCKEKGIELIIQ